MRCPICSSSDSSVIDTRPSEDGLSIRRRRECDKCQYRFSTMEEMELLDIIVIKSDGRRETYMRDKLEAGIRRALTKRPFATEKFNHLIHSIERDIQKKKTKEVSSKAIGEIVIKHLKNFDKVAYIRFASIYRDFRDVNSFEREVKKLSKATT